MITAKQHRWIVVGASLLTAVGVWLAVNGDALGLDAQAVATGGALINLIVTVLRSLEGAK